ILAKNGFKYTLKFRTGIPDNNIKKIINDSDIIMFIFIEPRVMTSHQINMINSLYNYFQKENKQK
ncbi:MAG: hypothetical protein LBT79_00725, partial [Elusimicrobiota bacterium]|nr:hypothetical protein [Elusimicrobiota bacterium]